MVMVSFPATKCTGVLPHIGSCSTQKMLAKGVMSHVQDLRIYGRDTYVPQVRECDVLHVDAAGKVC